MAVLLLVFECLVVTPVHDVLVSFIVGVWPRIQVSPHSGLMLVAAQMAGGVLAFPLLAACLRPYGLDFGA